jgi:ribonuclease Z
MHTCTPKVTMPYNITGISTAGERTSINVLDLGVNFDMGQLFRKALSANTVALSHSHMDHIGALPMWFDQRHFTGRNISRCLCHPRDAKHLDRMLQSWVDIEVFNSREGFPFQVIPVEPGEDVPLTNNRYLRTIASSHTCPSMSWVIMERRKKLLPELVGSSKDKILELKNSGHQIHRFTDFPLVAYTGDTLRDDFLERDEFVNAEVLITECTYFDDDCRDKAKDRGHLHVDDLYDLLDIWQSNNIVITHISRRTSVDSAFEQIITTRPEHAHRISFIK